VGGAFTISDPTLHNNITAICSANQFLYIFGDDSIDVLSNVQVSGGITTFTRTNISASIGTNIPTSVFPYYRSVLFANKLGFYSLSGATPQKISRDLDRLVSAIDFTKPIYGGQVSVFNILCAAFLVWFTDTFTPANTNRPILCVFFDNKWWFSSQGTALTAITSVPTQGNPALWMMDGTNLYQAFAQPAGGIASRVQTKLWDGGAPMLDKATVRAGVGVFFAGAGGQVISVTTDNEIESDAVPSIGTLPVVSWINKASVITTWQNNTNQITQWQISSGYLLLMGYAVTGGGKYFGMTVTSANNQLDYQLLAVEHASTRQW
jgi:hypothetical protein